MTTEKQITLFGATGFLGRAVIRRLAKTGARLIVVTRNTERVLPLKSMGDVGQIVGFLGSVRNDESVIKAIGSSTAVINLVGILYEKKRNTFQAIHVEAAARLARIARELNVERFLHVSALGANPGSLSTYARSKAAGEQAVRLFFPDATVLRPSLVYGPEDNFFNRFSRMASVMPTLPLLGGGTSRFQPVYVGDVAEAVSVALHRASTRGQNYDLGGNDVYSFRELLTLILKIRHLNRAFLNIPWPVAMFQAACLEGLPKPPLTVDQVRLLKSDNVIRNPNAKTLRDLSIAPASLEMILPTYLV